ncbi:MAG TPA: IPT/TIG domain-containing protein [Terracidiphilus sp.]|nr:IPT/TIG domain-containing protein [Terracidiphilus sp.]
MSCRLRSSLACFAVSLISFAPVSLQAGGPKYVAGVTYFNPAVVGQPVHWSGGAVNYYVDQGPLNSQVSNQQATAMVDAAAALWSVVPTAAVALTDAATLNEDVSAANVVAGNSVFAAPADVTPSAVNYPLGVVYDADGSVINALFGAGASDPTSCQNNGVLVWLDNIQPDATVAHAIILLNGLCATTTNQLTMMSYELERAFGRVLGLDYAQVNPGALTNGEFNGAMGWPIMQPMSGVCSSMGGNCIPEPTVLRFDDIAALNRIYPVTAANIAEFPGKVLTAANTVSIQGTLAFHDGTGMQGVNVVARPLGANGDPLYEYTVTFVSGAYFSGRHGNPVTGVADANGVPFSKWGSNDPSLQGYFDLRFMPLPPGVATAGYQVTFEAINPLYIDDNSVGPYIDGSPTPSGTMPAISVPALSAGSSQTLTVTIPDSASDGIPDAIGSEALPRTLPSSGQWVGRLSQIGQADWFMFPIRAGHSFTLVTQALNESGAPTESKALLSLGVWDTFDPPGSAPVGWVPALNGWATGESWLNVSTPTDDVVRIGIADMRGDGRPDYTYAGWVLYADTVTPTHLPLSGGPIVIHGTGFRPSDAVQVSGKAAVVTSVSPNEITAIAPPASPGVTGSIDVEVDDLPIFYASTVLSGGISYDSGNGDALNLVTAPSNTVPIGVPIPFTVAALQPDLAPAPGVTVTYTVISGAATLGCGLASCAVAAAGDGLATITVAAASSSAAIVTAALTNGSSVQAHFTGGTPPVLTAITPTLSVAAGVTFNWSVQALVLNNGSPVSGQSVVWQPANGVSLQGSGTAMSNGSGIATQTLTIGPLAGGQQATSTACVNGTANCATFTATGARPEFTWLAPVSGTTQSLSVSGTPTQIVLRLRDANGNAVAGGSVSLYQALYAWAPPCPPHGRCVTTQLLASQSSAAVSAFDGTVIFTPASLPGIATNLVGLAATGNISAVNIAIEQHP